MDVSLAEGTHYSPEPLRKKAIRQLEILAKFNLDCRESHTTLFSLNQAIFPHYLQYFFTGLTKNLACCSPSP